MEEPVTYQHNLKVLCGLHIGDIVEFPRQLYSHWGIYAGEGNIIHLANADEINSLSLPPTSNGSCRNSVLSSFILTAAVSRKVKCNSYSDPNPVLYGKVRSDQFFAVAGKNKAKRNNYLDSKEEFEPSSAQMIVWRAKSKMGKPVFYDLFQYNCEHFATWCRYGEAASKHFLAKKKGFDPTHQRIPDVETIDITIQ